jgi:hypothetical protein
MSTVDSFQLFLNQSLKDFQTFNDTLALIGFYYFGKKLIQTAGITFTVGKTFILPKLNGSNHLKWVQLLGDWAVVAGKIELLYFIVELLLEY